MTEQRLYAAIASFVRNNQAPARATNVPTIGGNVTVLAALRVLDAFSTALHLPVDRSGTQPRFALTTDLIERWHALCDPNSVEPLTSGKWGSAMESVLAHINADRRQALSAGLINLRANLPNHVPWRLLESLIDIAGTQTVAEAVEVSSAVEKITADNRSSGNDIELLKDRTNGSRYDRLAAVAAIAAEQPPRAGGATPPPPKDFVDGLARLEAAGRMDMGRDILDRNVNPAGGGVWRLDDALEELRSLEGEEQEEED